MELGARLLRFLAYPDRALAKVRRCTRNATQNDQSNGHRPQYRQAHRLRCLFRDSHPLGFADRCLSERPSGIARDSTEAPVTKLGIFSFLNCGCESAQDIILIIFDININYPALFASDREPPAPAQTRTDCAQTPILGPVQEGGEITRLCSGGVRRRPVDPGEVLFCAYQHGVNVKTQRPD